MTAAQRWEARVALAMLPVGAVVLILSALALPLLLGQGADIAWRQPRNWGWLAGWHFLAAAMAVRNMRAGILTMSSLDWRFVPPTLLLTAGAVVAWPGWWLS